MRKELHQKIARVYDNIAGIYQDIINQPTDYLEEFTSRLPERARILDVGCGIGTDAGYLDQKGHRVSGIDLSRKMLDIARQNHPGVEFFLQDLRYPDFPRPSFDGILAAFSLIHLRKDDVIPTLKRYNSLLKPSGLLFLVLQSGPSQELFLTEPFKPDETTFLNIISEDEAGHILQRGGFEIILTRRRQPDRHHKEFDFTKLFLLARKI
jgi:SAM-dependent methyltransferase